MESCFHDRIGTTAPRFCGIACVIACLVTATPSLTHARDLPERPHDVHGSQVPRGHATAAFPNQLNALPYRSADIQILTLEQTQGTVLPNFELEWVEDDTPPVTPQPPDISPPPPAATGTTQSLSAISAAQMMATGRSALIPDQPIGWATVLVPALRLPDQRGGRVRIVGVDVTPPDLNLPEAGSRELAVALQTELQRLGCYLGRIDGDFGSGSRRALDQYLSRTDRSVSGQEPTPELLLMTRASTGRVCPPPVQTAPSGGNGAPRVVSTPAATPEPAQTQERRRRTIEDGLGNIFR
jgi:hypothetical protein